jgi:hypothetical protein
MKVELISRFDNRTISMIYTVKLNEIKLCDFLSLVEAQTLIQHLKLALNVDLHINMNLDERND